jgi:rhodanese-related sulfurtransferase
MNRVKTFKDLLEQTKKSISEINVDQARELFRRGGVLFLDVREPQEYEEGIVRGAYTLPRGLLELQIERAVPDRDREIVVYCAGGARSALAAKSLLEMGYRNVKSMTGGFTVWEAAGYEIQAPSGLQSEG